MTTPALKIGDRVRLITTPPFFKTADPMPMLRPPDLVTVGAEGDVTEQRAGGYWVVKFERGSFLLDAQYLAPTSPEESATETSSSESPDE